MSNKQMPASTSVRIRMDDVKVFGPGIAELLERIDRCEPIRTATMEMKIAYSNAWTMLRSCEAALSYPLIQRKVGGAGGGGQPMHDGEECAEARGNVLWDLNHKMHLRFSHENPDVQALYKEYLGKPLSERSHHLLHTDIDGGQMPKEL